MSMRARPVMLDAPSNLGLRPPAAGVVPGVYKGPWALREAGLLAALNARDGGTVIPPRYESAWEPGTGVRNGDAIVRYAKKLAARIKALLSEGDFPIVIGGDCSILLGSMLALHARGRHGLVFLDGHSDFRHPGNTDDVVAAAGEDLALVTGRGDPRLLALAAGPLVRDSDVFVAGPRETDEHLAELADLGVPLLTSRAVKSLGPAEAARRIFGHVERPELEGFWIHLDWDILDGSLLPAVDCPEPDGVDHALLSNLLGMLVSSPRCVGIECTIYDPDLDEDGRYATELSSCLARALNQNVGHG